jgi:uncharacterized repeat protein (TIGR01451 family)
VHSLGKNRQTNNLFDISIRSITKWRNHMNTKRFRLQVALFMIVLIISLFGPQGQAMAKPAQVINSAASALDIANAIAADPTWVTGASFVSPLPVANTATAVSDTALTSFPTDGLTYGILTTGSATAVETPGIFTSTDLTGPSVRGDTDFDVTILKIDLMVPAGFNCLTLNFQFLSEEWPIFVNSTFNDAFIAELDASTWATSGSVISAPTNFAFDQAFDVVSINTTGNMGMMPAHGAGTAFDSAGGDPQHGAATPLLGASSPITPGSHSVYLSIFDQGDHIFDSAVFIDNLMLGHLVDVTECLGGKIPADLSLTKSDSPDPATAGGSLAYTLTGTNNGPGNAPGVTVTDTLPAGVTFDPATSSPGCTELAGVVTCDLGDLTNAASATATIGVTVDSAACGSTLTNTAVVASAVSDPDSSNNTASADTTVDCPTPTCTILDDFNRADGPLGSDWDGQTSGYRIKSNEVAVRAGGPIYWQPEAYGADQEACVTLTRINPKSKQHGLLLKVQELNDWRQGAIRVSYNALSGNVNVEARDVGANQWTMVGSLTPPMQVVDGDQLRAKAFADGTVEVLINDTSIGTADAGSFYAGQGGQIGLWFRGRGGEDDNNDDHDRLLQTREKDDEDDGDGSAALRALLDGFGGGTIAAP